MDSSDQADFSSYLPKFSEGSISPKSIAAGSCFLCGGPPSSGLGEHVFPKWLQNRFNLWDQRITLLNGTLIPYRKLTIPCCTNCNTAVLSNLEREFAQAFLSKDPLTSGDRLTAARWLAKIFLGILWRESSLMLDRKRPKSGTIIPANFFEDLLHTHLLIQTVRKRTTFHCLHGPFPATLYSYKIDPPDECENFGIWTNVIGLAIGMQLGHLGIVAVFDGGLQYEAGLGGPFNLDGATIHPIQFRELVARIHCKATLRSASHRYLLNETPSSLTVNQISVSGSYMQPPSHNEIAIFSDWDEERLAHFLAAFFEEPIDNVFDAELGVCRSALFKSDGSLRLPYAGSQM